MEWEKKNAVDAARWFCERLRIDPAALGFGQPRDDAPPRPGRGGSDDEPPPSDGGEPPPPEHEPAGPTPQPGDIWVYGGLRHQAAKEGLAAMKRAGIEFYVRGGKLVLLAANKRNDGEGQIIVTPLIDEVPEALLCQALGQSARWLKLNAKGRIIRIDPPDPIVSQALKMSWLWPFPPLAGLIAAPTIRRDGTLLKDPGYDHPTGLFLTLAHDLRLPRLDPRPSRLMAERALQTLCELLAGFPFADRPSRAVALSLVISTVVRGAMRVCPLHLVTAPLPGTGKSFLVDVASKIATGEGAAVLAMAPKEEETEKRLIGAALGANQMIVLDNVTRLVQGDFLNQVSEQAILQLRPLGTSALVTVPNTFVCVIDGNNLTVADDMVRRCVQCRLDANVAEPERREFAFDPMERVAADRGQYVAACLTIVLAYVAAGSPGRLSAPASYREWSNRVRSALVWLGEDDPLVTVEELREDDPGRQRRFDVFQAWSELGELALHEEGLRTRELIAMAQAAVPLHEALLAVASGHSVNSDKIDVKRLGNWLKSQTGAIAAGVKLVVDRGDKTRPRWRLQPA